MTRRVGAVCLDVDGTLTDGVLGPVLPGALAAVRVVREVAPVKLVTNTTSVPRVVLATRLREQGLLESAADLWTPWTVASRVLPERGHGAGILIADPAQRSEHGWFREDPDGPAVLLATEAHRWRVEEFEPAFRRILAGAAFYSLSRNRYFKKGDRLVTDLGPVAALLAYAGGREAETLGKPSALLFDAVARDAGVRRGDLIMVGDDAEFDASASIRLGMRGVLVATGKYRAGDESAADPAPTATLPSIADLPAWIRSW